MRHPSNPAGRGSPLGPILDTPLLYLPDNGGTVVATDIHVGLSREEGLPEGSMAGSPGSLAEALISGARRAGAGHILLLGDVKEPIVGGSRTVRKEVYQFFSKLVTAGLEVEVCTGNHDVGLDRMVPESVKVHPSTGLLRGEVGLFHGHAWPSKEILSSAGTLVVGHLHPGFRLAHRKERCWLRTRIKAGGGLRAREVIVLPAFNPLCSSEALNVEKPRRSRSFLVRRFLLSGETRAYLLDGTDLGVVNLGLPRG